MINQNLFLAVEPPILTPYYAIIYWVTFVMLGLVLLIGICDITLQWYLKRQKEKRKKRRSSIDTKLQEMFDTDGPFSTSGFKKVGFEDLLPALHDFNKGIDTEQKRTKWNKMLAALEDDYLLPRARRHVTSHRWTRRLKSIRCFAFACRPEDEKNILHLIKDKIPIIRHTASQIAGQFASPAAIDAILEEMNTSTHYMRHKFQDALEKGGESTYSYLEKKLETETNPYIRVSCLEVLKKRMTVYALNLIQDDLKSENKNLKIAAIHAVGHFDHPQSPPLLIPLMTDKDWEVRAAAARALGYLGPLAEAVDALATACTDKVWWVRVNAAFGLRRMGEKGKQKLQSFQADGDRFAYAIAQYALAFDNPIKKIDRTSYQEPKIGIVD